LKKKLFKNIGWKIGGLVLALALWFHLTTERQFTRDITLDIEYVNVPTNLDVSPDSPRSAIVEITTKGKMLFKLLYFDEPKIAIDVSEFILPGDYTMRFSPEQLSISSELTDVKATFIAPLYCEFKLVAAASENN